MTTTFTSLGNLEDTEYAAPSHRMPTGSHSVTDSEFLQLKLYTLNLALFQPALACHTENQKPFCLMAFCGMTHQANGFNHRLRTHTSKPCFAAAACIMHMQPWFLCGFGLRLSDITYRKA